MSMSALQQIMRQEALKATNAKTSVSVGKIIDYQPENYIALVELYSADVDGTPALQTGWLPVFTPVIGLYAPPTPGDIVEVHYQEGSLQNGFICLRSYTNAMTKEQVPSGEFWYVHKTGSFFKFTNDGKVSINGNLEIDLTSPTINITITGTANITAGSVNIDSTNISLGDIDSALTGLMNDVAIGVFNSHVHTDPQGGFTSPPTTSLSSSALTTNVRAN